MTAGLQDLLLARSRCRPGSHRRIRYEGHIESTWECGASGCTAARASGQDRGEAWQLFTTQYNTLSQPNALDAALGFEFIGWLISSPGLPRGSSATAPSMRRARLFMGRVRWWGERANKGCAMSTLPVDVWTSQLSYPLLPWYPCSCNLARRCSACFIPCPRRTPLRMALRPVQRVARRQQKYGDPLTAEESRMMETGKGCRKIKRARDCRPAARAFIDRLQRVL